MLLHKFNELFDVLDEYRCSNISQERRKELELEFDKIWLEIQAITKHKGE